MTTNAMLLASKILLGECMCVPCNSQVDYETFDISAVSGVKYVGRKGTIAFEPGEYLCIVRHRDD